MKTRIQKLMDEGFKLKYVSLDSDEIEIFRDEEAIYKELSYLNEYEREKVLHLMLLRYDMGYYTFY